MSMLDYTPLDGEESGVDEWVANYHYDKFSRMVEYWLPVGTTTKLTTLMDTIELIVSDAAPVILTDEERDDIMGAISAVRSITDEMLYSRNS